MPKKIIKKQVISREEIIKNRLIQIMNDQETISQDVHPCPRCGENSMRSDDNALSRQVDVYICSDCGIDEAINGEIEMEEWHFVKHI